MKSFLYPILVFVGIISLLSCKEQYTINPIHYAAVRVRILYNANQQPIPNALVTLAPNNRVLTTDASGICRFDSVLAGGYTLQAAKAGYVTQVATVTATTDASPQITLLLADDKSPVLYTTVRGRVLYDANQQPAQNTQVTLAPNNRVVNTDASGGFRFDSVLAGSYTLQAVKAGYTTQVVSVSATTAVIPSLTLLLKADQVPNNPPSLPTLLAPAINSTIQSNTVTFKWKATDPNLDTLTYDVLLFKAGATSPTFSYTGLRVDSLVVPNLDYNTSYLWQVIVKDRTNTVNGPIWSFATNSYPTYSYVFARLINGQYQIFASNTTGTMVQLTRNGSNWRPVASPNGQQIAFISNANTTLQLFLMNLDGSNIRQLTTIPIAGLYQTDLSFCWSPDGTQLLYPSNNRLYAIRTDGTGSRLVTQASVGRIFAGCDWTSQGGRIAARTTGSSVYDNEITTFNPDGSDVKSVYNQTARRVGNPVFSVTGNQLVFSVDSSGFMNDQGRQLDARIHLLDLTTRGLTDLSVIRNGTQPLTGKLAGTNDLDPRFSPNGAQILFTNTDNSGNGVRSVYSIDIDGRNRKLLFTSAEMPYWRLP